MPNLYAHYTLGQRALQKMEPAQAAIVNEVPNPYVLGLQGPDFLFYGSVIRDRLAKDFGEGLHHYSGKEIFDIFLAPYEGKPMSTAVRSYLMGFLGHYTLDVIAHPYVFRTQTSIETHLALETDFDIALLRKADIKPWKNKLYNYCPKDQVTQDTVAEVYRPWQDEISPERVALAAKDLHNIRRIMRTPNKAKYRLLRLIMEKKGIYDTNYGMLIPPPTAENPSGESWPDRPKDSLTILDEKLNQALPVFLENLNHLDARIDEGKPLPAFFEHNFEGERKKA